MKVYFIIWQGSGATCDKKGWEPEPQSKTTSLHPLLNTDSQILYHIFNKGREYWFNPHTSHEINPASLERERWITVLIMHRYGWSTQLHLCLKGVELDRTGCSSQVHPAVYLWYTPVTRSNMEAQPRPDQTRLELSKSHKCCLKITLAIYNSCLCSRRGSS